MIIGIEFSRCKLVDEETHQRKSYIRIAPYFHGIKPSSEFAIKAASIGVVLFTAVIVLGKIFEQQ